MDNVTLAWIVGSIVAGLIITFSGAVFTALLAFGLWILKDYLKHRTTPIKGLVEEAHCTQCKGDMLTRIAEVKEDRRDDREEMRQSLQANSAEHGKLFACLSKIEAEMAYVAGRLRNGANLPRRETNGDEPGA